MCCAIVAMVLALFPAWTGGREAVLAWIARARWLALGGFAAVTLAAGTALAAVHAMPAQNGDVPWIMKMCSVLHD